MTGKGPIQVRWVDINKGDDAHPNYRSRLVAKEFKNGVRPELYAPTPPGECLKLMLSQLASKKGAKLMYADVSRAYFYAKAVRPVYVVLPPEDQEDGDQGMVGELVMSMYGTRDAALNWATEYSDTLLKSGYVQGRANGCLFHHPNKDVSILVHGDDFVAVGNDVELAEARATLEDKYKLKVQMLGEGTGCVNELRILNKVVRRTPAGIELEADPRHAEIVIKDLGLQQAKASRTPGIKEVKPRNAQDSDGGRYADVLTEGEYIRSQSSSANGPREDEQEMSPIQNSAGRRRIKNAKRGKIGAATLTGERVKVIGHGMGTIRGIGCCGHGSNKAHIEYDDHTVHHCKIEDIEGEQWETEDGEPVLSADMPGHDDDDQEIDDYLGPEESRKFRAIAARLNYLAPDRLDMPGQ